MLPWTTSCFSETHGRLVPGWFLWKIIIIMIMIIFIIVIIVSYYYCCYFCCFYCYCNYYYYTADRLRVITWILWQHYLLGGVPVEASDSRCTHLVVEDSVTELPSGLVDESQCQVVKQEVWLLLLNSRSANAVKKMAVFTLEDKHIVWHLFVWCQFTSYYCRLVHLDRQIVWEKSSFQTTKYFD